MILTPAFFLLSLQPQAPFDLGQALSQSDIPRIEKEAPRLTGRDRDLARAVLLSAKGQDGKAEAALKSLLKKGLAKERQPLAWGELSRIRLRNLNFAGTVEALEKAKAASPDRWTPSDSQTLAFAKSLVSAPKRKTGPLSPGKLPLRRDLAGLMRADFRINGVNQDCVIDTGAGFSTISESKAKELKLKELPGDLSIGSSTIESISSKVAIASEFYAGPIRFENVIFLVLPDSSLSFLNGAYKIDAIVGFPELLALRRLGVTMEEGKEVFAFGPNSVLEPVTGGAPLFHVGIRPMAVVQAPEKQGSLVFHLDTGARTTSLNQRALTAIPRLKEGALRAPDRTEGAGGARVDQEALQLPSLSLLLGDHSVSLKRISLGSETDSESDGRMGQDVLKSGKGWVLDFDAMTLTILRA